MKTHRKRTCSPSTQEHPRTALTRFHRGTIRKVCEKDGLRGNYKDHLKKLRQRKQIAFDETTQAYVKLVN
ncbi:MAG: hypothetical protein ILA39_01335 [Bacteroidaceae bacterium]|nr:hypothetical protein [Bacteroidaceae bacterium]